MEPESGQAPDRRLNILLLLSDEHGFRYMGHVPEAAGGEPVDTPALDRLAAQAAVFPDAYCQMPLCTPSRISLLTGREVRGCGAWRNTSVLRPGRPTLPGMLRDAGYATALVGKMHLGGTQQFVGFQHRPYGDLTGRAGHQHEPLESSDKGMRARTRDGVGVTGIPESLLQDQVVCQETLAFVREQRHAAPDQPWFVCAGFSRPHFPLTAPRRHIDRYWPEGVTPPKVPAAGDAYDHPMSVGMRKGFMADEVSEEEMMRARAAYFACVSYFDEVLGDFLGRMDAAGLLENTIVVYTSDHGEMAGEHGVWWKNGWYDGCTRVPLIVSLPEHRTGSTPARRCERPVGLVDLFPTLLSLAGVVAPDGLDGADLAPAVRGEAPAPDRPVVCDVLIPRWGEGTEFRMVRQGRYKVVYFRNAEPLAFDLEADPGEQRNLLKRGEAPAAVISLLEYARSSMDFDEAERERTVRDADLAERFARHAPGCTGNLYMLPSGRIINAEDTLYAPTVIAERPEDLFGPDWQRQNS